MENEVMLTWIIPVYNGEKYLAQAIDSILGQPCGDLEVLVIDDGSRDNSLKIAQSYSDPRVKAIHKENGGVSSARNLGIEHARSKYIAFLDADDVVCRGAYDEELHSILAEEKYDLLSFSWYGADQDLKCGFFRPTEDTDENCDETRLDPFKHFCSLVYHCRLFEGESGIRFPEGLKLTEDVAFHYMAHHRAATIKNVDRVWFVYRNNTQSAVHNLINPDNVLRYSVTAWNWCKNRCGTQAARDHCDIRAFSTVSEYIRMSCMAGVPVAKIQAELESPAIRESLANYDILWNGSKAIYEAFLADPEGYRRRLRRKGIVRNAAQHLARLPILRGVYMKLKYRENIEALV